MKARFLLPAVALVFSAGAHGCSSDISVVRSTQRVSVTILDATKLGDRVNRKPVLVGEATESFPIRVEVQKQDGTRDTSFSGYVRVTVKPGTVVSLTGPTVVGRSIKVTKGVAEDTTAILTGTYGDTRILAEDIGYEPADSSFKPLPQCADNIDNDGDGKIDFPADEGCAYANDATETGGAYTAGASQAIFYQLPRIETVRGAVCAGLPPVCTGGAATPYKFQQVQIDTGYRESGVDQADPFVFNTVITRVSGSGFFATDLESDRNSRRGYSSLFAFNFNAPPNMRVCDRLKSLGGTATEFFGSIQLGYPTWTLEQWDPLKRPCLVPEPTTLLTVDAGNFDKKVSLMHALVRLITTDEARLDGRKPTEPIREYLYLPGGLPQCTAPNDHCQELGLKHAYIDHVTSVRVTPKFGPKLATCAEPDQTGAVACTFAEDASNCDFTGDGSVDFNNPREDACSTACGNDAECTEWSNYAARTTFSLTVDETLRNTRGEVVKDSKGTPISARAKFQADGSASAGFDALAHRGKTIRAFSGSLNYFSGGRQFTIEARCVDDIVLDLTKLPKSSNEACVFPRTSEELESQ